jgi:hypothetical protein
MRRRNTKRQPLQSNGSLEMCPEVKGLFTTITSDNGLAKTAKCDG